MLINSPTVRSKERCAIRRRSADHLYVGHHYPENEKENEKGPGSD
jgi:hypothetical protein